MMARGGCCLGTLLMALGMVLLFGFIVIPSVPGAGDSDLVVGSLEPLFCKTGEALEIDSRQQTDMRGTMYSADTYCVNNDGARREVTDRVNMYGLVGFVGPFLVGLLLMLGGVIGMASRATRAAVESPQALLSSWGITSPEGGMNVRVNGVPVSTGQAGSPAGMSLSVNGVPVNPGQASHPASAEQKLRQLDDLLARNMITQKEYERLRQQVLDESF